MSPAAPSSGGPVFAPDPSVTSDGPAVGLDARHDYTGSKSLAIGNGKKVQNMVNKFITSPNRRASRLPASVQFPLILLLSFSVSSLGYSFLNESTRGELATIARAPGSNLEVAIMLFWRVFELGLGWFGNFDGYDLASLNVLSHGPTLFLAAAFYDISPWTAGAYLAIDSLSALGPFLLLRPLSETHVASLAVPNGEIVSDRNVKVSTGLLAGLVYGVTLLVAVKTYLGTTFVLYFEGITRVEPALDTKYGLISATLLVGLLGLAAQSFIFTPFEATSPAVASKTEALDPVTATLSGTLRWNPWGLSRRTHVVILRTGLVMLTTWINTYLQCTMTIQGVDSYGAAAYASTWAVAAMMTGTALELVGDA